MSHSRFLLLIFIFQGLIGCSTLLPTQKLPEFPLFPPAELGKDMQVTQLVTSQVNDLPQVMMAAWSIADNQMNLVGLTVTGQVILRLQYDGEKLTEEYSPMLSVPINGRIVISQTQLAYWPLIKIQKQLQGTDWKLLQDQQQREVTFKNHSVTTIKAKNKSTKPALFNQQWPELVLESPILNQQLTIKTISTGMNNEQ